MPSLLLNNNATAKLIVKENKPSKPFDVVLNFVCTDEVMGSYVVTHHLNLTG